LSLLPAEAGHAIKMNAMAMSRRHHASLPGPARDRLPVHPVPLRRPGSQDILSSFIEKRGYGGI
jgi:hypothetical protein